MSVPIAIRDDYDGAMLRDLAKASKDANQTRRLRSLALVYEGGRRGDAASLGGVGLQIIRDWVVRFNAEGAPGLVDRKTPGPPSKLNQEQREALARIVEAGPIPAIHEVVRWRLIDLMQWVWEEFAISLSQATMSRELNALGYRKISARPRHHDQNEFAIEDFKKTSPPSWRRSRRASRPAPR